MKKEEIEKITNSIINKVGEENSKVIMDDLTKIILENERMNNEINSRDSLISKKDERINLLSETTASLYQQVGGKNFSNNSGNNSKNPFLDKEPETFDDSEKKMSIKECFDKNRKVRFIEKI